MPEPIPENKNVLHPQQQQMIPTGQPTVNPPVRPMQRARPTRPVAEPVTAPPLRPRRVTNPPVPRPVPNYPRGEVRTPPPAPARVTRPPVRQRQNGGTGFVGGVFKLFINVAILALLIWGATFVFPGLRQVGIIAAIARFVQNVINAIWSFCVMVYDRRDAIFAFITSHPLLSAVAGILVILCIVLIRKTARNMR